MIQTDDDVHILITGGCGFIDQRLARPLLSRGYVEVAGGPAQIISRLTLTDRVEPPADLTRDNRVRFEYGDLLDVIAAETPL